MSINWKQLWKDVGRREWLCRHPPSYCPRCSTDQIQIIDAISKPAIWKCRACKQVFSFEPFEVP